MAQVSISVADIQIGVEDEDASAKQLKKLAVQTAIEIVGLFTVEKTEEVDEEKGDG